MNAAAGLIGVYGVDRLSRGIGFAGGGNSFDNAEAHQYKHTHFNPSSRNMHHVCPDRETDDHHSKSCQVKSKGHSCDSLCRLSLPQPSRQAGELEFGSIRVTHPAQQLPAQTRNAERRAGQVRQGECSVAADLTPPTFHEHVTIMPVTPSRRHPNRMFPWRNIPPARFPDIRMSVPAMIAANPNMPRARTRGPMLDDDLRRSDADHHFRCLNGTYTKRGTQQCATKKFPHYDLSLHGSRARR